MGIFIDKKQKEALDPVNNEIFNIRTASASPFEKALGVFMVAAPTSYYYAAKQEAAARQGKPLSDAQDYVRRNPLLTAIGSTAFIRSTSKGIGHSINDAKSSIKASKVKKQSKKARGLFSTKLSSLGGTLGIEKMNPETINIIYKELIS